MGNLTYVSSKRNLVGDEVDAQLREINERRFGGFFKIERLEGDGWSFEWKDYDRPCWVFWIHKKRRRLGGKHALPVQWVQWAWAIFQGELATAWKGRISDDGVGETWGPDLEKFPTFTDWQAMWHKHSSLPSDTLAQWRALEISEIPEEFRPYALPQDS